MFPIGHFGLNVNQGKKDRAGPVVTPQLHHHFIFLTSRLDRIVFHFTRLRGIRSTYLKWVKLKSPPHTFGFRTER